MIRQDFQKRSDIESHMLQDMYKKTENIQAGTDEELTVRINKLETDFENIDLNETVKDKNDKLHKQGVEDHSKRIASLEVSPGGWGATDGTIQAQHG